jgi:hypothetical protein
MRIAAVCAALALVLTGTASATESTVYPGVGIGKVKLGMSAIQVKKALGTDYLVNRRENGYLELGWDFSHWTVTFAQQGRTLRAVQVATDVHNQRTPRGIGYGTLWYTLVHTYPGGKCGWGNHYSAYGFYLEYLVGRKGGTQTLYSLQEVFAHNPTRVVKYKIIELRVRTTFEPLTEFGPSRQWRCSDDWRATDIPRYLPA